MARGDTTITIAVASRENSIGDDAITITDTKSMTKVVFDTRMRSPGHRSNLLDPALIEIGVARVLDGKSSSQMAVRQAMMNADQIGL